MESVAELQWKYNSVNKTNSGQEINEEILCCIGVPQINLVKVPFKVSCTHPSRAKIGEPIIVKFTVRNISEDVLPIWVSMGAEIKKDDHISFLIAGESMS